MTQRELEDLTVEDCYALVAGQQVGRLVYLDDLGPLAVPVNYVLAGKDVIFRSEANAHLAAATQPFVSFEVDHVSQDDHSGWSVLLRGKLEMVDIDDAAALIHSMEGAVPAPWAAAVHNTWLRLVPSIVTGRRLGQTRVLPVF
jgi:nitroimidazol reductase NimA-like FMN-containing flavoprotein (pyridoxamine 5'-phosphate oxidase superfamily)